MADQFEKAPPLPRGLTDIDVPALSTGDQSPVPEDRPAPPPPPKFPSLTDVNLPNAKSAAATSTSEPAPESNIFDPTAAPPPSATTETIPPSSNPSEQPATTATSPERDEGETDDGLDHDALHEDIMAAIQRDAVVPGTGERRADEIGRELWTASDQQELDRLLAEGQDVYVPPDVGVADLPVARASGYAYVPIPPTDVGVDASPDQRSMADRIAVWNQVVPRETAGQPQAAATSTSASSYVAPAAAGAAAGAAAAAAGEGDDVTDAATDGASASRSAAPAVDDSFSRSADASQSGAAQQQAGSAAAGDAVTSAVEGETKAKENKVTTNADVSKSIFGASFYTVPVVSRKYTQVDKMAVANTDSQPAAMHDVLLKANSSASVKVVEDYGLKGGHESVINDAAFMDADKTLITCGADGKVCIWDMSDRSVQREFVPYEGEAVTMVYPLPDDGEDMSTIMTLSESRLMRIWCVDENQAVLLRNNPIKSSESDLYMSVPVISKQLKARAIAATAAAAVRTSDMNPEMAVGATGTAASASTVPVVPATVPAGPSAAANMGNAEAAGAGIVTEVGSTTTSGGKTGSLERVRPKETTEEEDKERRRFSLQKVFSRNPRRAVAS